ncbi:MAG: IS21 family transposase [Bacteroidota bacterium]|nr:IS21 family transposase [Bacteroidota bacterium]
MAYTPITMLQIRRMLQLLEKGESKRSISRILHSGKHTIDKYVDRIDQSGQELSELLKLSDAQLLVLMYPLRNDLKPDPRLQFLLDKLPLYQKELTRTGVTKLLLWKEYRQEVPDGYGYSQFCERLADYQKKNEATMHFNHHPGDFIQIDFAGEKISYIDPATGEFIDCPVLVCILPYSGYTYAEALPSGAQEYMFAAMGRCMDYFEGVPKNALSDNMKQYVTKSNRYEPVFSTVSEQWAVHYNINLTAARVRKPKDKPSVENIVKVAYMRIYAPMRNESYYNLVSLNKRILECCGIHNRTLMQKCSYSRYDRFIKNEKPTLRPLPSEPFIIKHTAKAKVQKNYHVILGEDWHQYSVPFQYIAKQVVIVYDCEEVEIYIGQLRIASHKRNYSKHGYTTLKEHMPESHQRYNETKEWDSDYFLEQAKEIGESSFEIFTHILASRAFPEQTYIACIGLLRMAMRYGEERFENACTRALHASQVSYRMIENILANNMDKLQDDQLILLSSIPDHENIRGPQSYH